MIHAISPHPGDVINQGRGLERGGRAKGWALILVMSSLRGWPFSEGAGLKNPGDGTSLKGGVAKGSGWDVLSPHPGDLINEGQGNKGWDVICPHLGDHVISKKGERFTEWVRLKDGKCFVLILVMSSLRRVGFVVGGVYSWHG